MYNYLEFKIHIQNSRQWHRIMWSDTTRTVQPSSTLHFITTPKVAQIRLLTSNTVNVKNLQKFTSLPPNLLCNLKLSDAWGTFIFPLKSSKFLCNVSSPLWKVINLHSLVFLPVMFNSHYDRCYFQNLSRIMHNTSFSRHSLTFPTAAALQKPNADHKFSIFSFGEGFLICFLFVNTIYFNNN
jgi:hypothetical protein